MNKTKKEEKTHSQELKEMLNDLNYFSESISENKKSYIKMDEQTKELLITKDSRKIVEIMDEMYIEIEQIMTLHKLAWGGMEEEDPNLSNEELEKELMEEALE